MRGKVLIFILSLFLIGCSSYGKQYDYCRSLEGGKIYCYFNAALWSSAIEAAEVKKDIEK